MPTERTVVTEVATGLGMTGVESLEEALEKRPECLHDVGDETFARLGELYRSGAFDEEFASSFANGRAFLLADEALGGRRPRLIEWTGGRRPPGDEVVPADLRVDHVYLVSCKYLSKILHNASPARVVEGLLSTAPVDDGRDWYERVAKDAYEGLFEACRKSFVGALRASRLGDLTTSQRRLIAASLASGWGEAEPAYRELCTAVAKRTAEIWRARIEEASSEALFWRLVRIASVPYFVLGAQAKGSMRLRIDTPYDWRRSFRLLDFEVVAQGGGQPRVGWSAWCEERATSRAVAVRGHLEIRWSHGRFSQPPEAKVYLDVAHEDVPGYHRLGELSDKATVSMPPPRLFDLEDPPCPPSR